MWNRLIIIALISMNFQLNAQNTVLEQDVADQLENIDQGLGSAKHIFESTNKYGAFVSSIYENDSLRTKSGSFVFALGMQELWSLGKNFKLGYLFEWQYSVYKIKQDSAINKFSLFLEHDKQNLTFSQVNLGPVIRIKLRDKGNKIGQYLDLGAYGSINFGYTLLTRDQVDPMLNQGAKTIEIKQTRMDYMNRWNYGILVKLGQNSLNIWAKYRLSNSFKLSQNINEGKLLPELPRLAIGIGFSFASIAQNKNKDTVD